MIRIGIVKEYKIPNDYRTPFTPSQAKKIMSNKMMDIFCQKSDIRCYKDVEYLSKKIKRLVCQSIFNLNQICL